MVGREDALRIANATIELGEELRGLAKEEAPTPLSKVPWLSQLGNDAAFARGDCGPAVLAMWLRSFGHDVTVDDVSRQSGLGRGFSFTMPAHLIRAARHFDLDLYWRRYLDLWDLRNELDAGRPCIVLVNYPSLETKYDPVYTYGHWLLLVRYTVGYFYYHDPYWLDDRGANIEISNTLLSYAWNRNHLNGNSDRQALRSR